MGHFTAEGACCHAAAREPFAAADAARRYARDRAFEVLHIALVITVDLEARTIGGTATHRLRVNDARPGALQFDAVALTIDRVTVDGAEAGFTHDGETLIVRPRRQPARNAEITVAIAYHGRPERGLWFIAPDADQPNKPLQAWTQGQDEDARFWFPCFDSPNAKATTEVRVAVPHGYEAVSNGRLVERTSSGAHDIFHWSHDVPHVTYLVSLVVGRFDIVDDRADTVPLRYLVPVGAGGDALRTFGRTPKMMQVFGDLFGTPYPYAKYDQSVVSDFFFGGMENTTATTLFDYTLIDPSVEGIVDRDDLIAHELAHQWFGDLLTCREWSHAWLNEGFATFSETLWYEFGASRERGQYHLLEAARRYRDEDSGSYRRPIVCRTWETPTDIFDRHLYEKGACVLQQLRLELGDDAFFGSLRRYVRSHARGSVETVDLRRAIEAECGRNMDRFFDQWVFAPGHPELKVTHAWDATSLVLTLTVRQTQDTRDGTPVFHFPLRCRVWLSTGPVDRTFEITQSDHRFAWQLPSDPLGVRVASDGAPLVVADFGRPDGWLQHQLREDDLLGRTEAAHALATSATTAAREALAAALTADALWMVRGEIAASLGTIGTEAAATALFPALTDPDARVRIAALGALGRIRRPVVVDRLRAFISAGGAPIVRGHALRALGRVTREANAEVEALLGAAVAETGSWNDIVPRLAIEGLAALRTRSTEPVFRAATARTRHELTRAAAIGAVAGIGPLFDDRVPIRQLIEPLLRDPSFRIVGAAVSALRALGEPAAAGALDALAGRRFADARLRRQARDAAAALRAGRTREEALKNLEKRVEKQELETRKLAEKIPEPADKKAMAKATARRKAKPARAAPTNTRAKPKKAARARRKS